MRDVAHRQLDLLALLAEFLARRAHHHGDERQDRYHHQRQLPVHEQQRREQEDHRHPFTDYDLDRICCRPRDHGHVEGDTRNQVTGVMLVEIAVGQDQQVIEQLHTQIMHQSQETLARK